MGGAPFGVVVDAEVFGLSPYGGVVRYWNHLLAGLAAGRIPVRMVRPAVVKAPIPACSPADPADATHWIFHPSYLSVPAQAVEAMAFTLHDTIYEDLDETARELDPQGKAAELRRECLRLADLVICPSETSLDGLRRHYPQCRAQAWVVPEGVDSRFLGPVNLQARAAAQQLRARAGCSRAYLLHVGGREHYKNFRFLLAVYLESSLRRRFDLVVVGSQGASLAAEQEMIDRASGSPRVAFLGQVPTAVLAALYRDAAVLVTATLAEGFGLPPIEAAAGGTPVAHSDIPIFEETLGGDGEAFDPRDGRDCERAIVRAAASPDRHRASASARLRRRFSWDRSVQRTIAAYRSALGLG